MYIVDVYVFEMAEPNATLTIFNACIFLVFLHQGRVEFLFACLDGT